MSGRIGGRTALALAAALAALLALVQQTRRTQALPPAPIPPAPVELASRPRADVPAARAVKPRIKPRAEPRVEPREERGAGLRDKGEALGGRAPDREDRR